MRGGEEDKDRLGTMDNPYRFLGLYLIQKLMLFYQVKNIEYESTKS